LQLKRHFTCETPKSGTALFAPSMRYYCGTTDSCFLHVVFDAYETLSYKLVLLSVFIG